MMLRVTFAPTANGTILAQEQTENGVGFSKEFTLAEARMALLLDLLARPNQPVFSVSMSVTTMMLRQAVEALESRAASDATLKAREAGFVPVKP